jgi:deoxyxylulose-5-phosphate synthase
LVTVEENVIAGGAGSAVNEVLLAADAHIPVLNVGIPDRFIEHGSREDCLVSAGLDRGGLEQRILPWWQAHAPTGFARMRVGGRFRAGAFAAFRARRAARLSQ